MSNRIQTRIKLRNDTLTNWAESTVKIYKGEAALGYNATSGKYEIRIGTDDAGKTWTELASNNLTIPVANVVGLSDATYIYQLVEATTKGTFKLQKKLPTASTWTDVTSVSLTFQDGTDAEGYSATNPIALKDYVDEEISDAVAALDTSSNVGIASVSSNVVTLTKAVKEVDGIISEVTGTGSTITLEEVAMTGAAADVSVAADATSGLTAGTVQGTLEALKTAIDNVDSDAVVTMESADGTSGAILKTYSFYQGLTGSESAAEKEAKKIGTVNVPKDFLVKSGELKTVTTADVPYSGAVVGDKYLDLVLNTKDTSGGSETDSHVYIPVNDLFDSYTSGSTAGDPIEITVNNTNNTISATCNISGSATIATVSNGVVTLKAGVAQASGAVSNSSGSDITLAKVATTGTAADVAIVDSGDLITATNVETALQEVAGKANTAVQTVTGETALTTGASDDYVSVSASKNGTTVTLDSKVKVQAVSTASSSAMGLAEASDVKNYVDTEVAKKGAYLGTATALTQNTAAVTIGGASVTPNVGDICTYSGVEYIWEGATNGWVKLNAVQGAVDADGNAITITNNKLVLDNLIIDGGSASATIS